MWELGQVSRIFWAPVFSLLESWDSACLRGLWVVSELVRSCEVSLDEGRVVVDLRSRVPPLACHPPSGFPGSALKVQPWIAVQQQSAWAHVPWSWLLVVSYSTVTSAGVLVWFWACVVGEAGPVPLSPYLLVADAPGWNSCLGGRKCLRLNLRRKWGPREMGPCRGHRGPCCLPESLAPGICFSLSLACCLFLWQVCSCAFWAVTIFPGKYTGSDRARNVTSKMSTTFKKTAQENWFFPLPKSVFFFNYCTYSSILILRCRGILEKGMATHFSILTWRIPWTEEPGGL